MRSMRKVHGNRRPSAKSILTRRNVLSNPRRLPRLRKQSNMSAPNGTRNRRNRYRLSNRLNPLSRTILLRLRNTLWRHSPLRPRRDCCGAGGWYKLRRRYAVGARGAVVKEPHKAHAACAQRERAQNARKRQRKVFAQVRLFRACARRHR